MKVIPIKLHQLASIQTVFELPYDCLYTHSKLTLTICNNIHSKYFNITEEKQIN